MNEEENLTYVEYDPAWEFKSTSPTGAGLQFMELYNVTADPYQLNNIYPDVRDDLKERLHKTVGGVWLSLNLVVFTDGCRTSLLPTGLVVVHPVHDQVLTTQVSDDVFCQGA
jgi:hypothetical protein